MVVTGIPITLFAASRGIPHLAHGQWLDALFVYSTGGLVLLARPFAVLRMVRDPYTPPPKMGRIRRALVMLFLSNRNIGFVGVRYLVLACLVSVGSGASVRLSAKGSRTLYLLFSIAVALQFVEPVYLEYKRAKSGETDTQEAAFAIFTLSLAQVAFFALCQWRDFPQSEGWRQPPAPLLISPPPKKRFGVL